MIDQPIEGVVRIERLFHADEQQNGEEEEKTVEEVSWFQLKYSKTTISSLKDSLT